MKLRTYSRHVPRQSRSCPERRVQDTGHTPFRVCPVLNFADSRVSVARPKNTHLRPETIEFARCEAVPVRVFVDIRNRVKLTEPV